MKVLYISKGDYFNKYEMKGYSLEIYSDFFGAPSFVQYDFVIIEEETIVDELVSDSQVSSRIDDLNRSLRKGIVIAFLGTTLGSEFAHMAGLGLNYKSMPHCDMISFFKPSRVESVFKNNNIPYSVGNCIDFLPNEYEAFTYFHEKSCKVDVVRKIENSVIITLPNGDLFDYPESYLDLYNAIKSDYLDESEFELESPEWLSKYKILTEADIVKEISRIENEINELEGSLANYKNELVDVQKKKVPLWGTGQYLEDIISEMFSELGCKVYAPQDRTVDLVIEYNDFYAVLEIKGVTGSCKLKYSRQLENWVTAHEVKEMPKGIMVINTFRDIEPNQRDQKDFPDNVVDFSIARDHCLLTGIDLLNIYLTCLNEEDKIEQILTEMFTCVGVFSSDNVNKYI